MSDLRQRDEVVGGSPDDGQPLSLDLLDSGHERGDEIVSLEVGMRPRVGAAFHGEDGRSVRGKGLLLSFGGLTFG